MFSFSFITNNLHNSAFKNGVFTLRRESYAQKLSSLGERKYASEFQREAKLNFCLQENNIKKNMS